MPVVATIATAVGKVLMAATPSAAATVIMMTSALRFVRPVLILPTAMPTAVPTAGAYSHNSRIGTATAPAASMMPMVRW